MIFVGNKTTKERDKFLLIKKNHMKQTWKLFWDISAVIISLYFGYKVFIYSGEHISSFGYFPIGLMLGLLALGVGAFLIHGLELFFSWILFKIFKIRIQDDLPFDR